MNIVFPSVKTVSMLAADPGSIVRFPRVDDPLLALVTDHITNDVRSFVILNSTDSERHSAIFAEGWQDEEQCLCYKDELEFHLENASDTIDPYGHKWRRHSGVIVSIDDELYIRAAPLKTFSSGFYLVSVQTGALLTRRTSTDLWTFGAWQLWIKGKTPEQRIPLFNFDVRKKVQPA